MPKVGQFLASHPFPHSKLLSLCLTPPSTNLSTFSCGIPLDPSIYTQLQCHTPSYPLPTSNIFHSSNSSARFFVFMAPPFLSFILLFLINAAASSSAQGPPSPGYYPSSKIRSMGFDQGYRNLWGPQHQNEDQGGLSIWLDRSSGTIICFNNQVIIILLFSLVN